MYASQEACVKTIWLLAIATYLTVAFNYTSPNEGSFRVPLRQVGQLTRPKLRNECFTSQLTRIMANRTIYNLSQDGAVIDLTNRQQACRHALKPKKYFIGTFQIGTPPQSFDMLLDTGSDVLWVTHSKCRLNGRLWSVSGGRAGQFAIDRSSTFQRIGRERVSMVYGNDMRFSGWWIQDSVKIKDTRESKRSLEIRDQALALICLIDGPEDPYEPEFDGIVGLGFSSTKNTIPTLMENLQARKLISQPVISFYTNRLARNSPQLSTGELIFGPADRARYTGSILWAPVVRLPHWEIRAHSIRMLDDRAPRSGPGSPQAFACAHGCTAIVDTGTDCIFGPDTEVARLNEQYLGLYRNQLTPDIWFKLGPCQELITSVAKLSFVIQIGNTHLELKPDSFLLESETMEGAPVCMSALRSSGPPATSKPPADWLLGSAFIQNFYTIFDYGQKRVGFATPV